MQNHWLELNRKRKKDFWTVEFYHFNSCILKPRNVEVVSPDKTLISNGGFSGTASIIFHDATYATTDKELLNFFANVKNRISVWETRLRHYQGFLTQVEYFEMQNLVFSNFGLGKGSGDIKFSFNYGYIRHYRLI